MKTKKLLVITAIVCLLVGTSGAAMARNDCPEGSLAGGTFDEIVITDPGVDCSVVGVIVNGNVIVRDADQFTILGSLVNGNLRVINSVSALIANSTVEGGNLVTRGGEFSTVVRNIVIGGSIRVIDDKDSGNDSGFEQQQKVSVLQNLVFSGNLRVNGNEEADVGENKVTNGDITCSGNDRLDSKDNDAIGGRVNCSKSLFQ